MHIQYSLSLCCGGDMYTLNGGSKVTSFEKGLDDVKTNGNSNYFENHILRTRATTRTLADSDDFIIRENPFYSQKYSKAFEKSLDNPEEFWAEVGKCVTWNTPWTKVMDNSEPPFTKWFVGGKLNACYNAVDRHVEAGNGDRIAIIHDSPVTNSVRRITYSELQAQVSQLAGGLAALGVRKGDRVLIYMPLVAETIVAMLATVRLGAIHSVVFGGFAARELSSRIEHATPTVVIAASCGVEPNKIVRYKGILDEAIETSKYKPKTCIIFQRKNVEVCDLIPDRDISWDLALSMAEPHPPVPVEANDPLYILYTSGTTDQPKGIVRPTGGHIATLAWTMSNLYGMEKEDTWLAASDMGWVVGHSYICYGPLVYGMTTIMYEGKPDRTPDPGAYFRVIQEHKVNAILTAPTALRVIRREDPDAALGSRYSTRSLNYIFVAGENCDHETKAWAERVFAVPVLNHWWQTETGHAITANAVGLGQSTRPPKFTAGSPVPGYDVKVVRSDGSEADSLELGRIVVKLPLPPGTMSTLYQAPERFIETYFTQYPGYYDTMDAGYYDEYGYVYVTARDDDVINVAGHRMSTSALEDVLMQHPCVGDACVVGVPEPTKGEIPFGFIVLKSNIQKDEETVKAETVRMVRELIGPIAAFRHIDTIRGLPRTRSGKIARKSIADLARCKFVKISGTIEDPSIYKDVKLVLQKHGYALTAPDPL